jgi:hypothetical protein
MSLLARFLLGPFSSDPTVRLLRSEPVLALPPNAATSGVAAHAREWNLRAAPVDTGVLLAGDGVELHGPVSYDERLWRNAGLPAECTVAYAARFEFGETPVSPWAHYDLIAGLCTRVGGRWREHAGKAWQDGDTDPPDPWVFGPRMLAPEEALRLLTPILPGVVVADRDQTGYSVNADDLLIWVDAQYPTIYPLVGMQPWFASATQVTQYEIASTDTPEAPEQTARAAAAIAEATGGVVLGDNGFPWRGR